MIKITWSYADKSGGILYFDCPIHMTQHGIRISKTPGKYTSLINSGDSVENINISELNMMPTQCRGKFKIVDGQLIGG